MIDQVRRMKTGTRELVALAFLLIAALVASQTYTSYFLWIIPRGVSYVPDLISALAAALLILPIVRGDFLYSKRLTGLTVLNLFLIFYLTSAYAQIGLGGNKDFALLKGPSMIVTLIVIVLANLRPKKYGELAAIILAVFAAMNILDANQAMGLWGFVLVAATFFGVLFAMDVRKVLNTITGRTAPGDGALQT